MKQRIISILLAIIMVFNGSAVSAFAMDSDMGSGISVEYVEDTECICETKCTPVPDCTCDPAPGASGDLVHGEDCPLSGPETAVAHINPDCAVCSEENADLEEVCKGAATILRARISNTLPQENNLFYVYASGACYDIFGKDGGNRIQTTYRNVGYDAWLSTVENPLTSQNAERINVNGTTSTAAGGRIQVSNDFRFISDGQYLQVIYRLENLTDLPIEHVSLAASADVQIGDNDYASIYRTPTGFRMANERPAGVGAGRQFALACKNALGASTVDTLWFGYFNSRHDNLFKNASINELKDVDSGLAFSWKNRTIPAKDTLELSVTFSVNEIAASPILPDGDRPFKVFLSATGDKEIIIAAQVQDAAGVEDRLYYKVNGGEEHVLATVTATGQPININGTIPASTFAAPGVYNVDIWIMNSKGAASTAVTKVITVAADGDISVDGGFDSELPPTPGPDGNVLTSPITQEKLDQVFGPGNATVDNNTSPPTIHINKDMTTEETIIIQATPVTIDLGGNTITGGEDADPVIKFEGGGPNTITGGGNITGGNGGAGIEVGNGSEVVIGGGTEINGGNSSTGNGGDAITGGGSVIIGGGGSATGGNGGGSSGNGGNGVAVGGDVTIDNGGSATGGNGSGSGNGGNGTTTDGTNTIINGDATGGSGGSGTSGSNDNGGNGGNGANQSSGTVEGNGTATGGNGGGGAGTGTGGTGGTGVGGGATAGDNLITRDGISARVEVVGDAKTEVRLPYQAKTVDAVLTPEEKADKTITNVKVTLKVDDKTATKPDQAIIEGQKPANSVIGAYFDITLEKTLTQSGVEQSPVSVTDTNGKDIEITMTIPADMRGGSDYKVIRVHGTSGTVLETTQTGNDLTYKTDKFSTYAIAYKPAATSPSSSGGNGNGGGEYDFWIDAKEQVEAANKGDTIKVNAKDFDRMPASVMDALRKEGVGIVIKWSGGTDIVIPAGKAQRDEAGRIYWPLSLLAELYSGISYVDPTAVEWVNPETGGDYIAYSNGKLSQVGSVIELAAPTVRKSHASITPATAGFEEGAFAGTEDARRTNSRSIFVSTALMLAAIAVSSGVCFWENRDEEDEQNEWEAE